YPRVRVPRQVGRPASFARPVGTSGWLLPRLHGGPYSLPAQRTATRCTLTFWPWISPTFAGPIAIPCCGCTTKPKPSLRSRLRSCNGTEPTGPSGASLENCRNVVFPVNRDPEPRPLTGQPEHPPQHEPESRLSWQAESSTDGSCVSKRSCRKQPL